MKYPDLIDVVKETLGDCTKKTAEAVLDNVFEAMTAAIQAGDEVTIRNFGRFYSADRAARTARNPRTGEAISVPAKVVTKFSPRGDLKSSATA